MNKEDFLIIVLSILIFLMLFSEISHGKDRCQEYIPDIRQYSLEYLGPSFPHWYNVGCAITESSCRSNLISFDGGIGLFQLTPSTGITQEISKYIPVDPHDTKSNIRAQSYYMHLIKDVKFKSKSITFKKHKISPKDYVDYCGLNLSDLYRFYNSGYWFFYESTRKPNTKFVCNHDEMKKYCVRGGTYTDKAKTKWLSFCDVSYSYPNKVHDYSKPYKILPDQMNYWHSKTQVISSSSSNVIVKPEKPKEVKKEKPKEELKPYPNALPPPETIDFNKKDLGDETFCIFKELNFFSI